MILETKREYMKKYRAAHREELNAAHRRYVAEHRDELNAYDRRRWETHDRSVQYQKLYGITLREFEAQIARQNNLCPIGNHLFGPRGLKWNSPCQDHDHLSGKNRQVLCQRHNRALGMFQDSVADLESAIEYLRKHRV